MARRIAGRAAIGNEQTRRRFVTLRAIRATVTETTARKATTTASRSGDVPCATSKPNAGHGDRDDGSD
jgi:hypothetical protein